MFCKIGLRKHNYHYGYVHEPERSDKVYLRQCQRCKWHDWMKSAKMQNEKLVTVWCGLGRFPQHAVEPVWYASYDEFVRAIELRDD